MARHGKPPQRRTAGASECVVAGQRDGQKNNPSTDKRQGQTLRAFADLGEALTERELYAGRRHVGTIRETHHGAFVAVLGEEVLGQFDSIREATDALLEVAGPGAES